MKHLPVPNVVTAPLWLFLASEQTLLTDRWCPTSCLDRRVHRTSVYLHCAAFLSAANVAQFPFISRTLCPEPMIRQTLVLLWTVRVQPVLKCPLRLLRERSPKFLTGLSTYFRRPVTSRS